MPTLDRRLLAWSDDDDSNTEDGGNGGHTPAATSWSSYDRCTAAPALVDDVLVPPEGDSDGGRAGTALSPAGRHRPVLGTTRKTTCVAAGFVAVGCCGLCAYVAWRCRTTTT